MSRLKNKISSIRSFANWYFNLRRHGVPINFINNADYIDWYLKDRPRLQKYKNIHAGEDCFIVGNGPSLNKMDLTLLNGHHVFGLNKIQMIFEKQKFDLSYHVTVNNLIIEQLEDELNNGVFECPSFVSYNGSKNFAYSNPEVNKIYTKSQWSFYKSILQPISEGYTVTFVAMQIAFYMGFKNVFLIGVDHNFQQKGKANEEQKMENDDVNHFHPDYFKGNLWHLADLEGSEASFALAKHQFHSDERRIFDATVDGKLNIYQKISFKEAINRAKKK